MNRFQNQLSGGDLRSIGRSNAVAQQVLDQADFDTLFSCLLCKDRLVVMRAADAIEKITVRQPQYLQPHKAELFQMSIAAKEKELKWHLALLLPRLTLHPKELAVAWTILMASVKDKKASRIERVNALQGLFELTQKNTHLVPELAALMQALLTENIPSLNARIKILQKQL
jgi:hypothetical protein